MQVGGIRHRLSLVPSLPILLLLLVIVSEYPGAVSAACDAASWTCANGGCIAKTRLCDGTVDCIDKSDETRNSCMNNRCPSFAFRCAYGACVRGTRECDGTPDCADNSDELSPKCPPKLNSGETPDVTCADRNQFRCDSGECVSSTHKCDGNRECKDGSDETVTLCSHQRCPPWAFRCEYGACVHGRAMCNGTAECADGSDELASLCPNGTALIQQPQSNSKCTVRLSRNVLAFYASGEDTPTQRVYENALVDPFLSIVFRCVEGMTMIGDNYTYCLSDGKWSNLDPTCEQRCSFASLQSASITAICTYNSIGTPCSGSEGLRPGTTARISCANGYRKPSGQINDYVTCRESGYWSPSPMRCEQVCGTDGSPTGVPYIVGGEETNNTVVPWHVGIYSDIKVQDQFAQICGGTILTNRLVISAAHCFWSVNDDRIEDASHFRVGLGKFYRDWNAEEPLPVQKVKIKEIKYILGYRGVQDNYNADLVMLLLTDVIVFRSYIVPICIELNLQFSETYVVSNVDARVAGWGLQETNGVSAPTLRVIDMPTVSHSDCVGKVPPGFRRYVTTDKFCAGFIDRDQSVCQGDSGGGLVTWKEDDSNTRTYFLRGVVSTGENKQDSCNSNRLTTFTNVHFYSKFISDAMSEHG